MSHPDIHPHRPSRRRRPWAISLALTLALAASAAACADDDDRLEDAADAAAATVPTVAGAGAGPAQPHASGELFVAVNSPVAIDSAVVAESEGFQIARLLYDGLTAADDELAIVPAVARSWASADNQTWIFTLREGTTFHDGTPVTARSFVTAWNRAASPELASPVAYYGQLAGITGWTDVMEGRATEVSGVRAVDDLHLEVHLDAPNVLLPKILSHVVFSPVPSGDVDPSAPIGNGPYRIDGTFGPETETRLVRFDAYAGARGVPDSITFRAYADLTDAYAAAETGAVDVAWVGPDHYADVETDFPDRVLQTAVGTAVYVSFPVDTAPYDDVRVRRALSLAIDRARIDDELHAGFDEPSLGFAPAVAPGTVPGCDACHHDVAEAQRLAQQAGLAGTALKLYFPTGQGAEPDVAAIARGWEAALGVSVEVVGEEWPAFVEHSVAGFDGAHLNGWIWDYPSVENFLGSLFDSRATSNSSRYDNPEFDGRLDEFRSAASEEAGQASLDAAQELLFRDVPAAPAFDVVDVRVVSARVADVEVSPVDLVLYERIDVDRAQAIGASLD